MFLPDFRVNVSFPFICINTKEIDYWMDMLAYLTLKEAMRLHSKATEPFAFVPQLNDSPFVLYSYHHVMSVYHILATLIFVY